MSEPSKQSATAGRRGLKLLAILAGGLALILVAAYLLLTSGWFFKSVLLPKAGAAMQARLSADDATVSPFSGIVLSGFKMETTGAAPLLAVKQLSLRYSSLSDLLKGRIYLDEITLDGLEVRLVEDADGRNNWSRLIQPSDAPTQAPTSSAPPDLLIKKLVLSNTLLAYQQRHPTNAQSVEISGLNLTLENVGNRQTAALRLATLLKWHQQDGSQTQSLACPLSVEGTLTLDDKLLPTASQGRLKLEINQATGMLAETRALAGQLDWDWTPTEIKQGTLAFTRSNQPLAALHVRGPFQPARGEGKLQFELDRVGGQVLNLAVAMTGYSIPHASLSARGEIELAEQAQTIRAAGTLDAAQLSLAQRGNATPPADLRLRFAVEVQRANAWANLRELALTATLSNRPLVHATLTRPMQVSWGKTQGLPEESEFLLTVDNLNLADWRALLPDLDLGGQVDLRALVQSRNAGQTLALDARGGIRNLRLKLDTNLFTAAEIQAEARTLTTQFQRTDLAHLALRYLEGREKIFTATATGHVDHVRQDFHLKLDTEAALPRLLAQAGLTNAHLSSGNLQFSGEVTQHNHAPTNAPAPLLSQSIVSQWRLQNLSGKYEDFVLDRLSAEVDSHLVLSNDWVLIRRLQARSSQAGQPAGFLEMSGQHHLTRTNGQLSLQLSNVNERLFQSAAALLGSNRLESARLNAALVMAYAPGQWSAHGSLQLTNCLLTDPAGTWPREPLTAELQLDVSQRAALLEARRVHAHFQFNQRDAGTVELAGQWDASRTNAQFKARVRGLNENALRPWLARALAPATLESISMEAEAEGRYQPGAPTYLSASAQVSRLSWRDAAGQRPPEPLALGLMLDAASPLANRLELRTASLQLAPTARATNRVEIKGQIALANLSAITGRLDIASEGLDWTPYHRLYKALAQTNATPPASPSTVQVEAPPTTLPLTNFLITARASHFYLEELAASNFTAWVRVDGPRLSLSNWTATLNGAPARGRVDLNLAVPGYQYDLDLQLQRLPLAPLAASFLTPSPDPWQGDLSLALALKGKGSTGPNLRQHLSGHFHLEVTNAALRIKQLLTPPRGATTTPSQQFLRVLVGILDPLLNAVGTAVGVPNLIAQPFTTSRLQMEIGQGAIELRDFTLANSTIIVGSRGRIPMADVLTASPLDLPVEISLSVPLAQRLQIVSAAPGASHVKLPDFVAVRGTLDNPQTRLNTKAITGTALQRVGKEVGGEAGALLQGVGNLLGGGTKAVTNAPPPPTQPKPTPPNTNAPINNLINDLFRPKPKP
ncbi:MAG: AsmA family protein [Verrucomicrobiae bacterium]|nr:AsmA family protein [Verrucomicrobiae bacterium]